MPIYEFECADCGARFEALVEAETERTECRECGKASAERRLSTFALSRQPTANQRRRMEDARGVDRGGARQRWQRSLDRARGRSGAGRRKPK